VAQHRVGARRCGTRVSGANNSERTTTLRAPYRVGRPGERARLAAPKKKRPGQIYFQKFGVNIARSPFTAGEWGSPTCVSNIEGKEKQPMTKFSTKKLASFAALVAPVVAVTGAAVAGGGGAEFDVAVTQLTDWLEGGLGQLLALAALAVGLGIGIVQQSVMAVVVGIGMAIAVFYGPGILTGIISGAVGL